MATADTSTPEGVRVDTSPLWGNIYQGTAEALIAAGLVRFDQLPGQPGRGKTVATYLPDGTMLPIRNNRSSSSEPGLVTIHKASARQYRVSVCVDEAEHERRCNLLDEAREQARQKQEVERERQRNRDAAAEAGMTLEQWALRGIPRTEAEHRSRVRDDIALYARMMQSALGGRNGFSYGFTFDQATHARARMLFDALADLIEKGAIQFDQDDHKRGVDEALEKHGLSPRYRRRRAALRLVG